MATNAAYRAEGVRVLSTDDATRVRVVLRHEEARVAAGLNTACPSEVRRLRRLLGMEI